MEAGLLSWTLRSAVPQQEWLGCRWTRWLSCNASAAHSVTNEEEHVFGLADFPKVSKPIVEDPAVSESRLMSQDSDLRDYVDAPDRGANVDDGEELESDSDEETAGAGKDPNSLVTAGAAGVLGMLYQFSKAQAEKGGGVNI